MNLFDDIIAHARQLRDIPHEAAHEYAEHSHAMTTMVDRALEEHPSLQALIGNNPIEKMYDNHKHHALFMSTVFRFNQFCLLARIVPWVYRSYSALGFMYDYFPVELTAWKRAVEQCLQPSSAQSINKIYDWMLDNHETMITLSKSLVPISPPMSDEWKEKRNQFLSMLLEGDHRKPLAFATECMDHDLTIENFYLHIIQPSLYEIGNLWESGVISVAQEHLSSSIVGRIMASLSSKITAPTTKGKVIITSAPNEYHEIGAWMISDLLEVAGWEVKYLGANTPQEDLLSCLQAFKPDILAISVTLPFNLDKAANIIDAMKDNPALKDIRVMLGGLGVRGAGNLWKTMKADGTAGNVKEAVELANQWYQEKIAS